MVKRRIQRAPAVMGIGLLLHSVHGLLPVSHPWKRIQTLHQPTIADISSLSSLSSLSSRRSYLTRRNVLPNEEDFYNNLDQNLAARWRSDPFEEYQSKEEQLMNLQQSPKNGAFNSKSVQNDFGAALAIVPPLRDWDRLQRARHFARDLLFHQWPPAIRLFHPFQGQALDVAEVIEELELEPFEITLDTFVIVPHLEALEAGWIAAQEHQTRSGPSDTYLSGSGDGGEEYENTQNFGWQTSKNEEQEIQNLIANEERIGREKALARAKKLARAAAEKGEEPPPPPTAIQALESESEDNDDVGKKSPSQIFEEQQQQFEEFGGPCVLCLEPDAESKQFLQDVREEMALLLDHNPYASSSSCYNWKKIKEPIFQPDGDYRPLIPIASFESLPQAMTVARRLKGLWGDPLTIQVDELHVISCHEDDDNAGFSSYWSGAGSSASQFSSTSDTPQDGIVQNAWGCNAKIKLMGQEMDQDNEETQEMIEKLLQEGEAGGLDISNDFTILDDEEEDSTSDIEMYLDNDDEWDEGSQVVIGRTHFFTGEQRTYKGMPASSAVDAKDRSLGDNGGGISGLARRRRTSTRSSKCWQDGEYGRRSYDHLPWGKMEKRGKSKGLFLDSDQDGEQSFSDITNDPLN